MRRAPSVEHTGWHHLVLCERMRARMLHAGDGPLGAPATEDQVQRAERRLGFRLPALLRRLYLTVADGGDVFGIGHEFYGLGGAGAGTTDPNGQAPIEALVGTGERLDAGTVATLRAHPGAYVACQEAPRDFVVIAHLGDTVGLWLDGPSGMLFASDTVLDDDGEAGLGFSFWAASLEEGIQRTLDAAPFEGDGTRQPLFPVSGTLPARHAGTPSGDRDPGHTPWHSVASPVRSGTVPSAGRALPLHLADGVGAARRRLVAQMVALSRIGRAVADNAGHAGGEGAVQAGLGDLLRACATLEAWLFALEGDIRAGAFDADPRAPR